MSVVNWEDPFCETRETKALPDLWIPGKRVPPVSLDAIHERQKPLMPYIQEWLAAADEALKRIKGSTGGDLLVSSLRTSVAVDVLYRDLEATGILRSIGPIILTCSPITFPASRKPTLSVFDYLLPMQKISDAASDDAPSGQEKAILAAEMKLGLIRKVGLSSERDMPKDRIVVYPELLHFVGNWIENIISPITDLRFVEVTAGITWSTASQPSRVAPLAKPQLH